MSEKYRNPSATYNIPLNNSQNDVYRVGCAHLYHFLHINSKMDDCKPMMLKMHLELDDSSTSSIGEAAEQRNIVDNNSINGLRQSVQQLEEEMKALKDALLQAMDDVVNRIDCSPNVDNNATQESNSNKQANNENNLSDEQQNDIDNVASASASAGHHTNTIPDEIQKVIDLRDNCVYIENFKCTDSSLEKAFCNVRKLANEMNAEIPDDSIIHIEVVMKRDNYLDYYVYFCDAGIKEEFLKNRHFYVYHPYTSPLRIIDYSDWGIVNIRNVPSCETSLEMAYVNVIEMAEKMGISYHWNLRSFIDQIDVYRTESSLINYSVRFTSEFMKKKFLQGIDKLKEFPETKSLEIIDEGGCGSSFRNANNFSKIVAGANVTEVAKLMGLSSLVTDNFKRIYVLNYVPYYYRTGLYFVVEFSSKEVKDEFIKKKHECSSNPLIVDINKEKNIALIKSLVSVKAFSFSRLAK